MAKLHNVLFWNVFRKGEINSLSGITGGTGVFHSIVARILEPILENNIVIEKKIGKQMRSFTLNEEHKATQLLMQFYNDLKKELGD